MSNDWTDEELEAAVTAYVQMSRLEATGKSYAKRPIYRELAQRFGRTDKAFEYRMQNISAVLAELNRPWIAGLKPASNVGNNVRPRLIALLERAEHQIDLPQSALPTEAPSKANLIAMREWLIEVAKHEGMKVTYGDMMETFGLDRFSILRALDPLGHESADNGEPILTALVVLKETGRCADGLATEFGVEDDEAERKRLYEYWKTKRVARQPDEPNAPLKVRAARFASVEVRPEQAAFRRRVFEAYKGRCVISGCDVREALDAAHLAGRHWRDGHNRAEDGLLLRKDLHALYDAGILRIDEGRRVVCAAGHYADLNGQQASMPELTEAEDDTP